MLTKTKQPELHRYWTTRDRAANVRLYRLAAKVLNAVEAGAFPTRVGWHCQDCPPEPLLGVGVSATHPPSPPLIFPDAPIRLGAPSALVTGPFGWRRHHAVPAVPG